MKISRLALAASTLALATACTPMQTSLDVLGVYIAPEVTNFGETCTVSAGTTPTSAYLSGTLNVGLTTSYVAVVSMKNNLASLDSVEATPQPNGNTANLTEMVLTYRTAGAGAVSMPAQEILPIGLNSEAGSTENVLMNLLGPQAQLALAATPAPTNPVDAFTVFVGIQFRGTLYSGSAVASNKFEYPIKIYNIPVSCPAGQVLRPSGACGNTGQDGASVSCCVLDATTGKCP